MPAIARVFALAPFLFLLACAPVRTTDDDDSVGGSPCVNADCSLGVSDGTVGCGQGGTPNQITTTLQDDSSLAVLHSAFSDGCCPDFSISATLVPEDGTIEVDYGITADFCDCICMLDASFVLEDLPGGTWELVLPGASTTLDL